MVFGPRCHGIMFMVANAYRVVTISMMLSVYAPQTDTLIPHLDQYIALASQARPDEASIPHFSSKLRRHPMGIAVAFTKGERLLSQRIHNSQSGPCSRVHQHCSELAYKKLHPRTTFPDSLQRGNTSFAFSNYGASRFEHVQDGTKEDRGQHDRHTSRDHYSHL